MHLLSPGRLGSLSIPNRVLFAPLTRVRADADNIPGDLMAEYYAQRASSGLLIAEATMVAADAQAWPHQPGIHSSAHVAGWRRVTDAVHAAGGRIYLQIWHPGRATHPALNKGVQPVSSSNKPIRNDHIHTPEGKQPYPTPRALATGEIPGIVAAFAKAVAEPDAKPAALAGVRVTELARREVWQGGRRLTFIRIAPPILPTRPAPVAAPPPAPTPEQLAAEERRAAKTYHHVSLMGAVYIGDATTPTVTEIRWPSPPENASESSDTASDSTSTARRHAAAEVRPLRAFVPFDLRHVHTFTELETADAIYGFTIFLSPVETASLREDQRPPELTLFTSAASAISRETAADTAGAPAYLFDGSEADAQALDATLTGLEFLLAHAQENRAALASDYARVEAENAERTRQAALNPPRPKNETIYFWKIQ